MSIPSGYRRVVVVLSESEYQTLCDAAPLTAPGTVAAALREAARLSPTAYGLTAALERQEKGRNRS